MRWASRERYRITARRPVERRLGVDQPGDAPGLLQTPREASGIGKMRNGSVECLFLVGMSHREFLEHASAEQGCEHLDRSEEAVASKRPPTGLDTELTIGHHAVQVLALAERV